MAGNTVSAGDAMIAALQQDCQVLGLQTSHGELTQLHTYLQQLQRWNQTYNLTAIRDPEAMRIQHLVDSLAVVPILDRLAQQQGGATPFRIVDVGSGGGLPGVVLAIMRPSWQVTCVDAVAKKTTFVQQVARVLALPNLSACHARIERASLIPAHVVISRAFASLRDFVTLAGDHVAPGGVILAMKGRHPGEELAELESAGLPWRVCQIVPLQVPGLAAERCVVWLERHAVPA